MKTSPLKIIETVSEYYGVSIDEMCSGVRKKEIIKAVHTSIYLIYIYTNLKQENIIILFNRKERSGVSNIIKTIQNLIWSDKKFAYEIELLEEALFPVEKAQKKRYFDISKKEPIDIFMENDFYTEKMIV